MTQPTITHCSNAHQILEAIIQHVFLHETMRHQTCIDKIGDEAGVWQAAFLFKAQTYRKSQGATGRVALPETGWPSMELFLKDKEMVENDSRRMWQVLFPAIFPCTDLQGVRDVLPDIVVELIPELRSMPRTKQEMWSVQDDQRILRQFKEIRERMEFYISLRNNPQLSQLMQCYHYEA